MSFVYSAAARQSLASFPVRLLLGLGLLTAFCAARPHYDTIHPAAPISTTHAFARTEAAAELAAVTPAAR